MNGNSVDGVQGTEAEIDRPRSMELMSGGGYSWGQPYSNRVRTVGSDGRIGTLAGTGVAGFSGDGGPATAAQLNFVHGAAQLADGSVVVADELNNRIRKIDTAGTITTVAGNGVQGYGGDNGPATEASINNPRGIAAMPDGGFLIPDSNNHRVRRVWPDGTITTVAGTGVQGFSGDGGPATSAQLSIPFNVAPTADGGFLIVDMGNSRIRKVSAGGTITTVAGTGTDGYSGDNGPATAAQVNRPHAVAALPDGGFLIADAGNMRIRQVAADGTITTLAGTGVAGYGGDGGPASAAQLNWPKGIDVDASGNVYVADEQNNRIRFIGTPVAPANVTPPAVSGSATVGSTLTADPGGWTGTGPRIAYQWWRCDSSGAGCADISGATAKTYRVGSADAGSTLRARVTASNAAGSATADSSATAVVPSTASPPSNSSPPTISGTAEVGQVLTAAPGSWSGSEPISYAYQWRRCNSAGAGCADIGGAAASTYVPISADVGSTIRVRVNASNAAGASDYRSRVLGDGPRSYWRLSETSGAAVDLIGSANGAYVNGPTRGVPGLLTGDGDAAVSLDGSSQYLEVPANSAWTSGPFSIELLVKPSGPPANKTIWATNGKFVGWWLSTDGNGAVRMYIGNGSQWLSANGPVLNAGSTYHLAVTWNGSQARLYVNGALAVTGPSTSLSPAPAAAMRLGIPSTAVGQWWPGVLDDASFYSSVLTGAQIAAHYEASVYGSTASSAQTAAVTSADVAPANTSPPTITGTPQVGQQLTASTGTWTGTLPISYAFQWQQCDAGGGGCADVPGAVSSTYTPVPGDAGKTVRVVVTASNAAGSASAASAATAVIGSGSSGTLTFSIAASGDDGDIQNEGNVNRGYPPNGTITPKTSGTAVLVGRRLVSGHYRVVTVLLRFDTSALPDGATVTGATLKLFVTQKADTDNRGLVGEYYSASSWPIDAADYSLNSTANALAAVDITGIATGALDSFPLTGLTGISTAGYTALRLHVDGGQPSGDNAVQLAAWDNTTAPEAQLVVTYTVP